MPILSVNPGGLDFGDVTQGHTASLALSLTNDDPVFQINITGATSSDPAFSGLTALTINPGDTQVVSITFVAGTLGTIIATLTITSDADNNPVTIGLQGSSVVLGTKALSVSPSAYIFPATRAGSNSAPVTFTITNTGTVNCTVQIPVVSGPFTGVGLPGAPTTLVPSGRIAFQVEFSPVGGGYIVQPEGIVIASDAPSSPFNVDLEGQGVLITPAYVVVGGAENGYMAVGPFLRQVLSADFNTEEQAQTIEKLLLLSGPGYEDTMLRVELQYEDRGVATVTITATNEKGESTFQQNAIGTATPAVKIRHMLFDLKIVGELINLEITSQGPLSIVGIIPRYIRAGEVKK